MYLSRLKILQAAKAQGFHLAELVHPSSLKSYGAALLQRQDKGWVTPFEHNNPWVRVSPERIMPEVKTILLLGLSYNAGKASIQTQGTSFAADTTETKWLANPARYAQGMDYHQVIKQKMHALIEAIEADVGQFTSKAFVDSSPLLEKQLAEKTGLGWIGKNTCFYTAKTGSWIFLGQILMSLESDLPIDTEEKGTSPCSNCNLCVRACPTKALDGQYGLHPQKCLAYLSQTKQVIPEGYREFMSKVLIGCDICQEICPQNNRDGLILSDAFVPYQHKNIDMKVLLSLPNKAFNTMFSTAAFHWTGKKVLQRNAILLLANRGIVAAAPIIEGYLNHPDEWMRSHAKWALTKLKTSSCS